MSRELLTDLELTRRLAPSAPRALRRRWLDLVAPVVMVAALVLIAVALLWS